MWLLRFVRSQYLAFSVYVLCSGLCSVCWFWHAYTVYTAGGYGRRRLDPRCHDFVAFTSAELPMELRQYVQFRSTHRTFDRLLRLDIPPFPSPPNISRYAYDVTTLASTRETLVLRVRETHGGARTRGGACLYGEVVGPETRALCSFRDLFDAEYAVLCPLPPVGCANVTLQVQCVDFGAYSSHYGAVSRTVWHRQVCAGGGRRRDSDGASDTPLLAVLRRDAGTLNAAPWRRDAPRRPWSLANHPTAWSDAFAHALCRCVNTFDRIVLVGSSHMRYKFDFLAETCFERPAGLQNRHHSSSAGNVVLAWSPYAVDLQRTWRTELAEVPLTPKSLVILQSGSYELSFEGLPVAMETGIGAVVDAVRHLQGLSASLGFRLVFQTTPPVPDVNVAYTKGGRNNFAIAAFVQKLTIALRDLRVDIFDEYHALLPMQADNVCQNHYMCRVGTNPIKGDSGKMVLYQQLAEVCNSTNAR